MERYITGDEIIKFVNRLEREEKSKATIEKYTHDVKELMTWLDGRPVTMEIMREWKDYLINEAENPKASGSKSSGDESKDAKRLNTKTINAKICAFNKFSKCMGWGRLRLKTLKIQREMFRSEEKALEKIEYEKLIIESKETLGPMTALIIETFGATGMRVSELKHLTVRAVNRGKIEIILKGKVRTIIIQDKLKKKLKKYIKENKIKSGVVFKNKKGNPINRRQIWLMMKKAAEAAGIDGEKVFPHNLRHLFARMYYEMTKNLAALASLLGHSSMETTRLYILTTEESHQKTLSSMHLVI